MIIGAALVTLIFYANIVFTGLILTKTDDYDRHHLYNFCTTLDWTW